MPSVRHASIAAFAIAITSLPQVPAVAAPARAASAPAASAVAVTSGAASAASAPAATSPAKDLVLLGVGARCSYDNSGAELKAGWHDPGFDASTWRTGVAPFGHLEAVKTDVGRPQRATLFRCTFTAPNPATLDKVKLSGRFDDGAVLHVNGRDVGRINMPTGTTTSTTSATKVDPYDGTSWKTWTLDPSVLVEGENVLSVAVHQAADANWVSSDLTFIPRVVAEPRAEATSDASAPEASTPDESDAEASAPETPAAEPSTPESPAATPAGWKLAFADEFSATSLDTNRWKPYHNTYGDSDPYSLHCLTPGNVTQSSGTLRLAAKKGDVTCPGGKVRRYSSGMVGTRDVGRYYPLYGRYEIRAKVPHGQGIWPGLWLRHRYGASVGEVDIMEAFHSTAPGKATQTLHFPSQIGVNVAKKTTFIEQPEAATWHTYAAEITPAGDPSKVRFRMFIDGVQTLGYTNPKATQMTSVEKNAAWDIALSNYVGGKWVGDPAKNLGWMPANGGAGICGLGWKAPTNGPDSCPTTGMRLAQPGDQTLEIDYVRVYTPAQAG